MWINNPRRLWEGRGMTGMEVLVTGGLKLYERVGGGISVRGRPGRGGGRKYGDDMAWEAFESRSASAPSIRTLSRSSCKPNSRMGRLSSGRG